MFKVLQKFSQHMTYHSIKSWTSMALSMPFRVFFRFDFTLDSQQIFRCKWRFFSFLRRTLRMLQVIKSSKLHQLSLLSHQIYFNPPASTSKSQKNPTFYLTYREASTSFYQLWTLDHFRWNPPLYRVCYSFSHSRVMSWCSLSKWWLDGHLWPFRSVCSCGCFCYTILRPLECIIPSTLLRAHKLPNLKKRDPGILKLMKRWLLGLGSPIEFSNSMRQP